MRNQPNESPEDPVRINLWVTREDGQGVTKLDVGTGSVLGTYATDMKAFGVAFDDTAVWITDYVGGTLRKLDITSGQAIASYSVGSSAYPAGVAFDGSNIWVALTGNDAVIRK